MPTDFKRVPAVDKCFALLELFSASPDPLGISDISHRLALNKSTVFNLVHTLTDLNVLEKDSGGKFRFGSRLYTLGIAAGRRSALIQTVHPYLQVINDKTKLSAFLGLRSDTRAIIVDKVDTAHDIKISSEIGMRLPLLAGAGGKALLCQLPDDQIDRILRDNRLRRFTSRSCISKAAFKRDLQNVRREGIAVDVEEYIDGIVAFAVPINTRREDLQAAIWAVGLRRQVPESAFDEIAGCLKAVSAEINGRFRLNAGPVGCEAN
jgi:DNA-binding IclR family transcriptional regulator